MSILFIPDRPNVLAIGAHPDDIELGCGGFIHRLVHERKAKVYFAVLTGGELSSTSRKYLADERQREARNSARVLLGHASNSRAVSKRVAFGRMKDGELFKAGHDPIWFIEKLLLEHKKHPLDIILTHSPDELHDDHACTNRATLSAARNFHGSILFYQSPSSVPNRFSPTFFVELNRKALAAKNRALACHISQKNKTFLRRRTICDIARSWAVFHRIYNKNLEAFCVHQTFWRY